MDTLPSDSKSACNGVHSLHCVHRLHKNQRSFVHTEHCVHLVSPALHPRVASTRRMIAKYFSVTFLHHFMIRRNGEKLKSQSYNYEPLPKKNFESPQISSFCDYLPSISDMAVSDFRQPNTQKLIRDIQ